MMETVLRWTIAAHLVATLFMVGVIWFVQVVHYPLMRSQSASYCSEHVRRTGWLLPPVMLVEMATAFILAFQIASWPYLAGVASLAAIWLSTWFVQVPCHHRLVIAFDADTHRRLVTTNWIRTVLWSIRGALTVWPLADRFA